MDYLPLALGLGTFAGLVTYIEITLRREKLSGLCARQSIIDRRLLSMKSAIDRIERRLDAMTVDREVVDVEGRTVYSPAPSCNNDAPHGTVVKLAELYDTSPAQSRQPCLDCGLIGAHVANCALNMDDLVESPTDAAARRGRD